MWRSGISWWAGILATAFDRRCVAVAQTQRTRGDAEIALSLLFAARDDSKMTFANVLELELGF